MADPGQLIPQPRRDRARWSCTECRRRHQKCDGGQPCGQCYRRFPEPECVYEGRTPSSTSGTSSPRLKSTGPSQRSGSQSHRSADHVSVGAATTPDPSSREASLGPPVAGTTRPVDVEAAVAVDDAFIGSVVAELNALDALRRGKGKEASGGADPLGELIQGQSSGLSSRLLLIFGSIYTQQINLLETNPNSPSEFRSKFAPLCSTSPLLSRISIYMAARFLAEKKGLAAGVLLEIRGTAIRMLLEAVSSPASDETVAAVIHFINNDLCYNEIEHAQKAHLPGLRNAIIARGGINNLGMNGFLAKLAIITDLLAALTLESDHVLTSGRPSGNRQSASGSAVGDHFLFIDPLPRPAASIVSHNSPLLSPVTPFDTCELVLGISHSTALILNDIRVLLDKVLALEARPPSSVRPPQGRGSGHRRTASDTTVRAGPAAATEAERRVTEVANWLQTKIIEETARDRAAARRQWDPLHSAVLHAALLTTRAVAARRPVSEVDPAMAFIAANDGPTATARTARTDTLSIWGRICQVPLERWRRVPGILLWIGVTAAPLKDAALPAPVQRLTSTSPGTTTTTTNATAFATSSPLPTATAAEASSTPSSSSSSSSASSANHLPQPSPSSFSSPLPPPAFDCGVLGARALVHVAALQLATEDWAVAEGALRRAAAFAAWLRGGGPVATPAPTSSSALPRPPSAATPAPASRRAVVGPSAGDLHRQERAAKRMSLGRGGSRGSGRGG